MDILTLGIFSISLQSSNGSSSARLQSSFQLEETRWKTTQNQKQLKINVKTQHKILTMLLTTSIASPRLEAWNPVEIKDFKILL